MVILEDRPKAKDHLAVVKGEIVAVILIKHDKLPQNKLLVEKDDGTSERNLTSSVMSNFTNTGMPYMYMYVL